MFPFGNAHTAKLLLAWYQVCCADTDAAEDAMGAPDANGELGAADMRELERRDMWAAWAGDNPREAADMAAEAGWDVEDLPIL